MLLTIKISEKTEQRRPGVIPAPFSSQKTPVRKANQFTPMAEARN